MRAGGRERAELYNTLDVCVCVSLTSSSGTRGVFVMGFRCIFRSECTPPPPSSPGAPGERVGLTLSFVCFARPPPPACVRSNPSRVCAAAQRLELVTDAIVLDGGSRELPTPQDLAGKSQTRACL